MNRPKRISRAVRPEDLSDLLVGPPYASLAFAGEGRPDALPVAFRFDDGRYLIALPAEDAGLVRGRRVALLLDEGCYHTELRGIRVQGEAVEIEDAAGDRPSPVAWLEVRPQKVIAWDYGAMRDVRR